MKALLNGYREDDRYKFLQDLLVYTKGGVCNWKCVTTAGNPSEEWLSTCSPTSGKCIKIGMHPQDTPVSHKRSVTYGPKMFVVRYPLGAFVVYDSDLDRLAYDKYKEVLEAAIVRSSQEEVEVPTTPKENGELRLSGIVKAVFKDELCKCSPRVSIRPVGQFHNPNTYPKAMATLIGRHVVERCRDCGKILEYKLPIGDTLCGG